MKLHLSFKDSLKNNLKSGLKNEQGNFSIIAAFTIGTALLAAGIAVDISHTQKQNQNLQIAIDNAVLAAANIENENDATSLARDFFDANYTYDNAENISLNFSYSEESVIGEAQADIPLFFSSIIGKDTTPVRVRSEVRFGADEPAVPCIIALTTTQKGVSINGGADIIAPECGIHNASVSNPAGAYSSGTTLDIDRACNVGTNVIDHTGTTDIIETGCDPIVDPYAGIFPEPSDVSCDFNNQNFNSTSVTLNPGVYCGFFNFNNGNANVHFNPGTYVIRNGGWNVNGGTWTGDDVTFYFYDTSRIQFNSGVDLTINAPTDGPYANAFIIEREGLPNSDFILNASQGFDATGIVYLPSRQVIYNSGAQTNSIRMNIIVRRLTVNNGTISLLPIPLPGTPVLEEASFVPLYIAE